MKSSNSTDKMSNQNKDRYKSYLIEKLLNENSSLNNSNTKNNNNNNNNKINHSSHILID